MIRRTGCVLLLLAALIVAAGCGSGYHCNAELVLRAVPGKGQHVTPQGMELARQIIISRVRTIGVASPTVAIRGSDEIVIEFPGTSVPPRDTSIVAKPGQIEVFDFEADLAAPTVAHGVPTPYPSLYNLLSAVRSEAKSGVPEAYYLFNAQTHAVLRGPEPTKQALLAAIHGTKRRADMKILAVPANREAVEGPVSMTSTRPVGKSSNGQYWYLFKLPPEITGEQLNEGAISADVGQDGRPEVIFNFTRRGGREFQAITKAEYERGKQLAELHGSGNRLNQRYAQHNAIVFDGKLQATPYMDYTDADLQFGIPPGNGAVISTLGSMQAARALALVLRSGSLPYTFQEVSQTDCATLRR
jgi:preprotein translocase subunit SecD